MNQKYMNVSNGFNHIPLRNRAQRTDLLNPSSPHSLPLTHTNTHKHIENEPVCYS